MAAARPATEELALKEERAVPFCQDQADWLVEVGERYGLEGDVRSPVLERLVNLANSEPSQSKKMIFLVVRCHRCLQHTRGGEKRDCPVALPGQQWQWLEGVRERCRHPTVGKTLRIVLDFYRPILDKDPAFERLIFGGLAAAAPSAADAASTSPTAGATETPVEKSSAHKLEGCVAVMGG